MAWFGSWVAWRAAASDAPQCWKDLRAAALVSDIYLHPPTESTPADRSMPCHALPDPAQASNLGRRSVGAAASKAAADAALKGSECLGADTLLQLLKNYARSADIKTSITVGVVS